MNSRETEEDVAVLKERVTQLERRCDKKDIKIEKLEAFQNRVLGYTMAASAMVSMMFQYFTGKGH